MRRVGGRQEAGIVGSKVHDSCFCVGTLAVVCDLCWTVGLLRPWLKAESSTLCELACCGVTLQIQGLV